MMADPAINNAQKMRGRPFEKGQVPNPKGRPKGSRSKLGEAFLEALCDDFNANGIAAIQTVREEKPDQYLKVIASILPKQIEGEDGEPIKAEIIFRTVYEERGGD
jgi:hypothetical protein